jgi:ArsR family transcriptional regulator, virulence genes transcriptional regulator
MKINDSVGLAASAERAAEFLRALAHPARLRVVCALLDGELAAGELASRTGLRPPALSQQASVLEAGGAIRRRRAARSVLYSLSSPAVRAQARLLHRLFCAAPSRR